MVSCQRTGKENASINNDLIVLVHFARVLIDVRGEIPEGQFPSDIVSTTCVDRKKLANIF